MDYASIGDCEPSVGDDVGFAGGGGSYGDEPLAHSQQHFLEDRRYHAAEMGGGLDEEAHSHPTAYSLPSFSECQCPRPQLQPTNKRTRLQSYALLSCRHGQRGRPQ